MKDTLKLAAGISLVASMMAHAVPSSSSGVEYPGGKLAYLADGNSPDPDDIGGTAWGLAVLKEAFFARHLKHYTYCCDLDPFTNKGNQTITRAQERTRHTEMRKSCTETQRLWGLGDFNWQDGNRNPNASRNDLRDAINQASSRSPLYIIEAGEPDLIYRALNKARASKRKYVRIITHHVANDESGDFHNLSDIVRKWPKVKVLRIPDQNQRLQKPLRDWNWAKNHRQFKVRKLWDRIKVAEQDPAVSFQRGKGDISDAGMMVYWVTGADKPRDNGRKTPNIPIVRALIERNR